jgi:hypothetical protein
MAKVLQNIFSSGDRIAQDFTVESWHVSQSVDAFTGADDYDITISGSLTVIGPTVGSFIGSLQGTSSWANNAVTSSYILNAVSSSFASTASFVRNAQTASYVLNAVSSSFASTASFVNPLNQSVILTGSLNTSGSVTLRGLTTGPRSFVVTIDNATGQLYYTSSAAIISGSITPAGSNTQIQYNNAGAFAGTDRLTFDGTTLRATGSFSGSFNGIYNNLVSTGNTTAGEFQMVYASGSGTTAAISSSQLVVINPSTGRITSNRLQVDGAGTTSISSGVGQIWLNGASSNLIEYNANGYAPPTTGSRSIGTKIVLYPGINSTQIDYAIGIEDNTMWHSIPTSSYSGILTNFKWYAGTTNIATLNGLGAFSTIGSLSTNASIQAVGEIRSTNGDVIAFGSSDKRLKDNITPISNPIEKIQKIGGYEFDWNDKQDTYEGHDIGVIAQEIEEVLPELVTTRDNGYKAVKYEKIVALLIEAIKDQQKQIDDLKSKIG